MKHIKRALVASLAGIALALLLVAVWTMRTLADLPDVALLKRYRPAAASEVLDRNGSIITHFYEKKFRVWVSMAAVPDLVVQSVVTAEDDTFFGHKGVNYRAVWNALKHDVQKKRFARGGSTITQQMIKNVLLSREKTLARKLREFVLARRAEEVLTKRQILEIYLNEVEWGDGIHGIEAASRYYFDKPCGDLTWAEAALLAGMLPNPRYYDPFQRPEKARQRQEQVLFNLFQAKYLTESQYAEALESPLVLREPSSKRFDLSALADVNGRPCHQKALEQVLVRHFGEQRIYREGLQIRTSLDRDLQDRILAVARPPDSDNADAPERVFVVKEGMEVRALLCASNEDAVWGFLLSLPTPEPGYTLNPEPLDSVEARDLLLSSPSGTSPEPLSSVATGTTATAP
jgi:penicillin-binding protein 1A